MFASRLVPYIRAGGDKAEVLKLARPWICESVSEETLKASRREELTLQEMFVRDGCDLAKTQSEPASLRDHSCFALQLVETQYVARAVDFLDPSSPLSAIRFAYRYLRESFPSPFSNAYWIVEDRSLSWSRDERAGAIKTPYGLDPENADLPQSFHLIASITCPHAVRAYRLIHLAHDLRWFASAVASARARAILKSPPKDQRFAAQQLASTSYKFAELIGEWRALWIAQQSSWKREVQRKTALEELSRYNEMRASSMEVWRTLVLKLAHEIRGENPRATVTSIAKAIEPVLELPPGQQKPTYNTIYQFLCAEMGRGGRHKERLDAHASLRSKL